MRRSRRPSQRSWRTLAAEAADPAVLPAIVLVLVLYLPFVSVYGWLSRNAPNVDLPSFHSAAVAAFELGQTPYVPQNLQGLMEQRVYPFLYPPPSLLVFAPLAALSYEHARIAVLAINHLLVLAFVVGAPLYLLDLSPKKGFPAWALCTAYTLTFYPTIKTIAHGQTNIVSLVLLAAAWLAARRGAPVLAGLALALAILLKTYAAILVPFLLLVRRFRESAWTVFWGALAAVLTFALLPASLWHEWITNVLPDGGYGRTPAGLFPPAAIWNQGLNGLFSRLFTESEWSTPLRHDPATGRTLTYLAAAVVAVVSAAACLRSFKRFGVGSLDRILPLALAAIYLVAPFSWEHHLVSVLLAVVVFLGSRCTWPAPARLTYWGAIVVGSVLIGAPGVPDYRCLGVVLLWIVGVVVAVSPGVDLSTEPIVATEAADRSASRSGEGRARR